LLEEKEIVIFVIKFYVTRAVLFDMANEDRVGIQTKAEPELRFVFAI
jgi:hypothetical protein